MAIGLASASAVAADDHWLSTSDGGASTAFIQNAFGSTMSISCPSDKAPTIAIVLKSIEARPQEFVEVVVDENTYSFDVADIHKRHPPTLTVDVNNQVARIKLGRLVKALIESRAASFNVVVPRLHTKEVFTLRDARKTLSEDGKTSVVDRCL